MIIALCGRRRCGKDTTVEIIQSMVMNFQRIGFADALKRMVSEDFNIPLNEMYDPATKETHRPRLQSQQAVYKDKYGLTIFAQILKEEIRAKNMTYVVISDMRYLFEWDSIKTEEKAFPFRVHSDKEFRALRGWVEGPTDLHDSETEMGDLTEDWFKPYNGGILVNNFTKKEDYVPTVRSMLEKVL